jgi:hypothetical protein
MHQQVHQLPALRVVIPSDDDGCFAIVARTWDEAEHALVVKRQPAPTPPQPEVAAKPARVRYEHD